FFMTSFSPLEAILSSFNWSENSRAGQVFLLGLKDLWHDLRDRIQRRSEVECVRPHYCTHSLATSAPRIHISSPRVSMLG
ncbi:hypothetical protein, partial [Burkholderia pseudomallei]|uniref:hypothetical protein n=1 Tax=Burkholderia pseudomallei TaxID=28450 RepID=UPI001C4C5769